MFCLACCILTFQWAFKCKKTSIAVESTQLHWITTLTPNLKLGRCEASVLLTRKDEDISLLGCIKAPYRAWFLSVWKKNAYLWLYYWWGFSINYGESDVWNCFGIECVLRWARLATASCLKRRNFSDARKQHRCKQSRWQSQFRSWFGTLSHYLGMIHSFKTDLSNTNTAY